LRDFGVAGLWGDHAAFYHSVVPCRYLISLKEILLKCRIEVSFLRWLRP
jgi:hypothetical protein